MSTFEDLIAEVKADLSITDQNILQKSIELPLLQTKYLDKYLTQFRLFKLKTLEKDKLYGELYHSVRFENDFDIKKSEVDPYINKDERYHLLSKQLVNIETILKFLEKTVETFKNLNFNIKNYLDLKKFLSGM